MKQLEMREIPGRGYQNDGSDRSGVYERYDDEYERYVSVRYADYKKLSKIAQKRKKITV